ncbi:MAG: TraB/GumN family protein [Stenotrophomonas sp.]|nr:TraB/GumN family protein [Stenotrophomonas sp.]
MPIKHLFRAALLLAACVVAPLATARDGQASPAAAAAAPAAKPPVPLLWKVTGPGDARVYLLGSFHLLKPQDYPLSPDVEQAFEASQRVVFELSPEDMQSPQLASRMVQAATRTDGSELKRDLDAATWQKLQAFAAQNQLPLAQMQGMKPWFVGLSISIGQMQKLGLDPALGLDRHFMERAQKTGRKTAGLEDIDTQIGMLDGMTVQEQRQMLAEALDQAGKADEQARLLHDAWRRGDERLLWTKMAAEMRQQYPQLYQRINTGRNDAWVPKLQPYLQAGQGGTLVVVGTLHLLGSDGVVEKLRAKGYKVERVCTGCKAKR